jgi:hypothetical protein
MRKSLPELDRQQSAKRRQLFKTPDKSKESPANHHNGPKSKKFPAHTPSPSTLGDFFITPPSGAKKSSGKKKKG